MTSPLLDLVDTTWARSLGCDVDLVRTPGAHLVPGGPELDGYSAVYMVRVDASVLVYCPTFLREAARAVVDGRPAEDVFTLSTLEAVAGDSIDVVRGPAWHGFVDDEHFVSAPEPIGERLAVDDDRLAALRDVCGNGEWTEAGFGFDGGVAYGVTTNGKLVAAGNMTPFRGLPADVGVLTHPEHRGRGLARALASRMIADALPTAGLVRYRSRTANAASLAVGRSLGFVGRGQNLMARLREERTG